MLAAKIPSYIKAVFISLLIIIIIFFMVMAKKILVPLMVSGYIAMLMTSFCNRLEKMRIPRSLSAFAALLLFAVLISGILYLIFSQLEGFTNDVEANMEENLNNFAIKTNGWVKGFSGYDMGMGAGFRKEKLVAMLESGNTTISELLFMTLGTLSDLILLPVFIFFLLIYRDHLAIFVTKVFEKQRNKILLEHMVSIRRIVQAYIVGAGKVMLILGIVNTIVLFSLGIKHAIFFGMIAGLLNIIPYVGPFVGALLPFFFALLTKDSLFYPIAIVVSFTFIQFLEGIFLTPKITGANVNLNAFVTFLGLLIGGAIWGVVGMLLIIPTIAILKKLFELSPDTEPYAYLFGEEDAQWFKRRRPKTES
ncbi:MAG TPA: AI-2E family transporter [Flavobacterium sp.]|nr:AI-2E family transporter [Flavobacterium sp.]